MTDPNPPPMLTAPATSPPPLVMQHQLRSLDDTIEHCIGEFGWKQFLQSTLISFAWFFDAQQSFISVFTDAEPKWSCNNSTSYNNSHFFSCNATSNICQLPKTSWSWDSPVRTSTISEWSLQCAGPIIRGLPASSFLLGCLVGGLVLATLADSNIGRKNMLVLSSLIMSLFGALTTVSTNIWMYTGLRFVSGLGRSTIGTCSLVLASELCTSRPMNLRDGFSSRGRKEEFANTLKSLASSPQHLNILTENFFENYKERTTKSREHHLYTTIKILLKKGWAFKRLIVVMLVGFSIGMAYYGMPFGLGNLSFNLYLSVTLNALSESLSSSILFFLIGKMTRKGSVVVLALLSGICNVMSVLVKLKGLQMGIELLSFFCACMAFDVLLIYTLELFPTCVRNSAVSMMREATLFGGFIGPLLVEVGRKNGLLSYGLFGTTIILCGLFVVWLPETKGRVLFDTMEEAERKDGEVNNGANCA
ncbi:hypothetical protein DH2020_008808 [Rehmannia glutinosa]|uniref:Uncharacterized protein n=1 Tax=Rehmannia glutinosa TaxID=99300 RepID=A0ABR0X877_REHGL